MKHQGKDEIFIGLDEIAKDRELNDLWNKFCEYEEKGLDEEQYKIAGDINKHLQDLFNKHHTDIIDYLWEFPIDDLKEVVKTFAEENGFICNGYSNVFQKIECNGDHRRVYKERIDNGYAGNTGVQNNANRSWPAPGHNHFS